MITRYSHCYSLVVISALLFPACARNSADDWEDIDYVKIAGENYHRENDTSYTAPSVIGCVDDDLYNCKVKKY